MGGGASMGGEAAPMGGGWGAPMGEEEGGGIWGEGCLGRVKGLLWDCWGAPMGWWEQHSWVRRRVGDWGRGVLGCLLAFKGLLWGCWGGGWHPWVLGTWGAPMGFPHGMMWVGAICGCQEGVVGVGSTHRCWRVLWSVWQHPWVLWGSWQHPWVLLPWASPPNRASIRLETRPRSRSCWNSRSG